MDYTIKGLQLLSSFLISYVYFTSLNIMTQPKWELIIKFIDLKYGKT
jgi:uncharacterized membrane protein YjgN (DUF898 family)